jgi:Zn-dependent metalloprotease
VIYGDGDGRVFRSMTRSLDVIGHEWTHGVIDHTSRLRYAGQSGALNEHFADVFGCLVRQWKDGTAATEADWTIGRGLMGPGTRFEAGLAYAGDPILGDDPQPKHMRDLYVGREDAGGVHLNSGIPNHAFYRAARALRGKARERARRVWWEALLRLDAHADFAEAARETRAAAVRLFGRGGTVAKAVAAAWNAVGV